MNPTNNLFIREKVVTDERYSYLKGFITQLPEEFPKLKNTIYARRNIVKIAEVGNEKLVVKSFQTPHLLNRIVYGKIRKSKAQRSFEYALRLQNMGIDTPQPIGYYEMQKGPLFTTSFYVCLLSECQHTFNDIVLHTDYPEKTQILTDLATFTAHLHKLGIRHLDYSAENILFSRDGNRTHIELVDLNRIRFGDVNMVQGCQNFERLNFDNESLTLLARVYAKARGFDENLCIKNILKMRWHKHITS